MAGKNPYYADKIVLKDGGVIETAGGTEIVSVDSSGTPSIKANIEDSLADGKIYVGSAAGVTSEVDMSGDATIVNSGAVTIGAKKVGAAKMALTEGSILRGAVGGAAEELAKGSANQILAMDGGGGFPGWTDPTVKTADVNISAAQIKGLAAAPFEILAAPSSGKGYEFLGAALKLVAGSEVLAEAADNLVFRYTNGSGVVVSDVVETTGFIDQAVDMVTFAIPVKDPIVTAAGIDGQSLVLHNNNAEITGNVSDDAELRVSVTYRSIQV